MRTVKKKKTICDNMTLDKFVSAKDVVILRYLGADVKTLCLLIVTALNAERHVAARRMTVVVACRKQLHGWTDRLRFVDPSHDMINVVGSYDFKIGMSPEDVEKMLGIQLGPVVGDTAPNSGWVAVHCGELPAKDEKEIVDNLKHDGYYVSVFADPGTDPSSHWHKDVIVPKSFDNMLLKMSEVGLVVAMDNCVLLAAERAMGMTVEPFIRWDKSAAKSSGQLIYRARPLSRSV